MLCNDGTNTVNSAKLLNKIVWTLNSTNPRHQDIATAWHKVSCKQTSIWKVLTAKLDM